MHDFTPRRRSQSNASISKLPLTPKQIRTRISIGVLLTLATIALQCVALFTPHWKEISPNTQSFKLDGIDALIRTELLIFFNSVHRFTRHSYGLFHRCEYPFGNASEYHKLRDDRIILQLAQQTPKCTKNFLPSYADEQFNQCHSLQYYQFCSRANAKRFNIDDHHPQPEFNVQPNSVNALTPSALCSCYYPAFVRAGQALMILSLVLLCTTAAIFGAFPFFEKQERGQLKLKCFGVLAAIFSSIVILINLLVIRSHFEFEATEYLLAIERHYRSSQIYKLSLDTKVAIARFLSSIDITTGYSMVIAWLVFVLSIVDGVLLTIFCKLSDEHNNNNNGDEKNNINHEFQGIPEDESLTDSPTIAAGLEPTTADSSGQPREHHRQSVPRITITEPEDLERSRAAFPKSCLKSASSSPPVNRAELVSL